MAGARVPVTDNLPMLLVALNLLLLCFFVLLNSLATQTTPKEDTHARKVLARVQEGYDVQGPEQVGEGTVLTVPTARWAEQMADQLQGVVMNRLSLTSKPLQADANRVVLTLPLNALFAEDKLVGVEAVRALVMSTQGSSTQWRIEAPLAKLGVLAAALGPLTGQVALQEGPAQTLVLVVKPGEEISPQAARGLQRVGEAQGATVKGEAAP